VRIIISVLLLFYISLDAKDYTKNPETMKFINKMVKELPIELNIFDIVYYEGKTLLKEPFKKWKVCNQTVI